MNDQETHFDIIRMLHSRTTDEDEDDTILMDDRQNRQGNIVGTFNDLEEDKQHNIGDDDDDDDDEEQVLVENVNKYPTEKNGTTNGNEVSDNDDETSNESTLRNMILYNTLRTQQWFGGK